MKNSFSSRTTALFFSAVLFLRLVLISTSALALDEDSQTYRNDSLPSSVTIYATRFEELVENSLPQTFIITDREIQKSGLGNVSEVLQKIGGFKNKRQTVPALF